MTEHPLPRLADYTSHVRRHGVRLTVTALLGAVIGAALFWSLPHRYVATSVVALSPQLSYLSLSSDEERPTLVTLDTTAALLRSDQALGAISEAMRVSPESADARMEISAKPGSRGLVIQVRGDSQRQAVAGANAATKSLLDQQRVALELDRDRVRLLKNRAALVRAQAQQQVLEGSPAGGLLDTAETLQRRLDAATTTNNPTSTVILRADPVEYRPGQVEVFVASGFVLGLVVGILSTLLGRRRG
ncbi:MAG TPA: hypothetical protein PLP61_06510 [Nocardioides sp.]|uniref:hypothetical protein n=1 Tax=Nocardioides sp. TaxID=35761 RepID=UPI002CE43C0A|nr:hypothetical protein [Nocardioides sp.]HQR26677.1 hypothetical protein [Nocardioides sp.]